MPNSNNKQKQQSRQKGYIAGKKKTNDNCHLPKAKLAKACLKSFKNRFDLNSGSFFLG